MQQKNIPVLRFPEFEGEWEKKKLGEISTTFSGGTPLTSIRAYFEGDIPFIKSGEIDSGQTEQYISEDAIRNSSAKRVNKGDLLYALYGATSGEVAISKIDGAINQAVLCVRTSLSTYFAYTFLVNNKSSIIRKFLQGGQGNLSAEIVKSINVNFPTLPEQQKIASFFTAIDQKISQLKKKQQLLEHYKKGVMQKIFSQQIRFKDDDGRAFPKWEKKRLGDIVQFRNGKAHEQNITEEGEYIVVNSKFISTEGKVRKLTDFQICPLQINEIVMVMSDIPNGKALAKCYLIEQNKKYSLNQRICALKATRVVPHLLFYVLNRNKYYLKFDSGVGQTNLAKDEVLSCPLTLPQSMKEQTKIANFLSAIDDKIHHTQKQIEQAEQWKKGLMQKMFV